MLPHDVSRLLDEFVDVLDRELPGVVEGVYVVGSLALDDYRPGVSDVDLVVVSAVDPGPAAQAALQRVQRVVTSPAAPVLDAIFLTWNDLAGPAGADAGWAHFGDGAVHPKAGYNANPPVWRTIARRGVTVRGPAPETLRVFDDDDEIVRFCRTDLLGYWANWASAARGFGKTAAFASTDAGLVWGALNPTRLHAEATTGRVISKGAGVAHIAQHFDGRFTTLVARARRVRDGGRGPSTRERWSQRSDLAALIEALAADVVLAPGS